MNEWEQFGYNDPNFKRGIAQATSEELEEALERCDDRKKEVIIKRELEKRDLPARAKKATIAADAIGKAIEGALDLFQVGYEKPVVNNRQLFERIQFYIKYCAERQQLPTLEKLYLAIGYTQSSVEAWYLDRGSRPDWVDDKTIHLLDRGRQLIAAIDSELVQTGKIKETAWWNRAKNFYGMTDKKEVVVTPNDEKRPSIEELRAEAALMQGRAAKSLTDGKK